MTSKPPKAKSKPAPRKAAPKDTSPRTNAEASPPYRNPDLAPEVRAKDLVARMTVEEKTAQIFSGAPAIPRLGVPEYHWWNECLHGVARAGIATVFPQAIGLAATWDVDLVHRAAAAIADEARAKHHEALRKGERGIYKGLTFWTPNINIFRDPRWGRGQETYGEDPFLTGEMGVAFTRGLQGDDPKHLKLVATPKHYVVHSGPEKDRHSFDARVSQKDLRETYLPAFKRCVVEGGAESVMSAYNRTNGECCTASPTFLQKILREEWGFRGYVVSDCGAVTDIFKNHKVVRTYPEAVGLALKNGCDLMCERPQYGEALAAAQQGFLPEDVLDQALVRLFIARFRLGMFDPPERVPYAQIPFEVNDCDEHRAMALQAARESIVLLKNQDNLLPLSKHLKSIAVIGPNADELDVLLGNYFGTPSAYATPLQGIRNKVGCKTKVEYAEGCDLTGPAADGIERAAEAARRCDVAVVVLGLTAEIEGEERMGANSDGGDDRSDLNLPGVQQQLLEAVHATGTPVVLVLTNGSPLTIPWADENIPAIVEAWYPGEEGGNALADVLFGDYNPSGRLPMTFVRSLDQVPPFDDYRMEGRTYRYMVEEPLYPFGYGLSYTVFEYSNLALSKSRLPPGENLVVSADVKNIGKRGGDEIVQLYTTDISTSAPAPLRQLQGFRRVPLRPGETATVEFVLTPRQLALINEEGKPVLEPGEFIISVGGRQPGSRPVNTLGVDILIERFDVVGEALELEY